MAGDSKQSAWYEWMAAIVAVLGLLTYLLSDNRTLTSLSLVATAVVAGYVAYRSLQKKK